MKTKWIVMIAAGAAALIAAAKAVREMEKTSREIDISWPGGWRHVDTQGDEFCSPEGSQFFDLRSKPVSKR